MNIPKPIKRPRTTKQEREYYSPNILESIIYVRSLGVIDNPAKGQPKPPEPRFEEPEEGEDLSCYIPDIDIVDGSNDPEFLALVNRLINEHIK